MCTGTRPLRRHPLAGKTNRQACKWAVSVGITAPSASVTSPDGCEAELNRSEVSVGVLRHPCRSHSLG